MNEIGGITKTYYGDKCEPVLIFGDFAYFHGSSSAYYVDVFEENKAKFIKSEDYFISTNLVSLRPEEPGSVYVAKDPTTGFVKIGKTSTTVDKRIESMNSARPVPIEDYVSFDCVDCGLAERKSHEALSDCRTYREWFSADMEKAKGVVKAITEKVNNGSIKRKKSRNANCHNKIYFTASGYQKMYDLCVLHDDTSSKQFGYVMLNYFGRAVAENKDLALFLLKKSREEKLFLVNDAYDRFERELLHDLSVSEAQRRN